MNVKNLKKPLDERGKIMGGIHRARAGTYHKKREHTYIRELLPDGYKQIEKKNKPPQELTEEEKKWLASTIDSCGSIYLDKD